MAITLRKKREAESLVARLDTAQSALQMKAVTKSEEAERLGALAAQSASEADLADEHMLAVGRAQAILLAAGVAL